MYLPNQKLLSELAPNVFPPTLRQLLKSSWIETLEEFLAVTGVLRNSQFQKPPILLEMEAILPELNRRLPTAALEVWLNGPIDSRNLGAQCPEEIREQYMLMGTLRNDNVIAPMNVPALPTSFLLPLTFPLRDQGDRGTCVACTIADFTQYVTQTNEPLSIDYIYTCCKMFDGYINDEGSDLQTALGVVGQFGICPEYCCQTLLSESSDISKVVHENDFPRIANIRPVLRGVIEDYKTKLTGADGTVPMPVPVSVLVFESSLRSQATGLTGKWTLPLAVEAVQTSGHAMLIIGYQDDPSVPGGGYFIARNSWGEDYASDSPVDLPGHALLPYEYIRRFCFEAYSGPEIPVETHNGENRGMTTGQSHGVSDSNAPNVRESEQIYVRKLEYDLREQITNRVLHKGDWVIAHPDEPNSVCAYSESSWRKFVTNGYAWNESQQQRNLFPEPDAQQEQYIALVKKVSGQFQSALATNLNDFENTPFPLPCGLFVSRPRKIDRVEKMTDLSEELAFALLDIPEICQKSLIPNRWKSELTSLTSMTVWGISSGKKNCHVVTVFPVGVQFGFNKKPQFPAPNSGTVNAMIKQYELWRTQQGISPDVTCFAVGSIFDLVDIVQGISYPTCFSHYNVQATDNWKSSSFNTGTVSLAEDFFPTRLRPVSVTERMERIRQTIDEKLARSYQGNLRADDFVQWLGYTHSEVIEAFKRLEMTDQYDVYKNQERDFIAIKKRSNKK